MCRNQNSALLSRGLAKPWHVSEEPHVPAVRSQTACEWSCRRVLFPRPPPALRAALKGSSQTWGERIEGELLTSHPSSRLILWANPHTDKAQLPWLEWNFITGYIDIWIKIDSNDNSYYLWSVFIKFVKSPSLSKCKKKYSVKVDNKNQVSFIQQSNDSCFLFLFF